MGVVTDELKMLLFGDQMDWQDTDYEEQIEPFR